MVLVDTSVWIDYLHLGDPRLEDLLRRGLVVVHPFVVGELACGRIHNRKAILGLLGVLPALRTAEDREVLALIERKPLYGQGVGYIDAHLIASCLIEQVSVWTRDKNLRGVTESLNLSYNA